MQPDTAYDIYATAIWDRDTLLLGVAVIVLVYGMAFAIANRFVPRVTRGAFWLLVGGFYVSMAMAFHYLR
jgi:uncharacterized BrkB/YihY/UPF0761 family membrane protein